MNTEEAKQLLIRYNAGECTEAEKSLVESSFLDFNEHEIDISDGMIAEIGKQIYKELPISRKQAIKINLWKGIGAVAAVTLLTVCTWGIFDKINIEAKQQIISDISPGRNQASITLDNGKTINLNGSKTAVIVSSKGLTYSDGTAISNLEQRSGIQTFSTPKGGQYQIILQDSTKVWLNASSSLKYPISFENAKQRGVELNGEAYFEVSPNKSKPFVVKSSLQTTEVLGTHFNINDYKDDGSTVTTLLEGSVRITNLSSKKIILKPNQQSITNDKAIKVQEADIETALAWKNGRLEFKNADIKSILKQASRWYNIEVEYRGVISNKTFNGGISRSSNLSVLLKILAYSGIHFTIERQENSTYKLIVTP
ncbi:iron dicitrate transport regulator FecR [Pedobacter sp. KBW01]|uniref:FecR family protein n=1 Tax=Pedobacter sp. KBW01 TaxID=2153364 RepID=UPI000F5AE534|nr:FecR family protein [Pedobacter sp. KBW01]RQO79080.1 iron dicitrate transport regulator FecR [Pedobacter sp. KBW01]